MKFKIKNLGPVEYAEVEVNNFTTITGANNTGKTYIVYAIYGFLTSWTDYHKNDLISSEDIIKNLNGNNSFILDLEKYKKNVYSKISNICKEYSKNIYKVFNSNQNVFEDVTIDVEIYEDEYKYGGKKDLLSYTFTFRLIFL